MVCSRFPRSIDSGKKDLKNYRSPKILSGFKNNSTLPTDSKVPFSLIQTHPVTRTVTQTGLYTVIVYVPDYRYSTALLNVGLSRSQRVNHLLFSGQAHNFSIASKIKKDSIQLETTQSLFSVARHILISHPL